jgi:hypothetical protein
MEIMASVTQLKRSSPEAEGIPSPAVLDFIRAVEHYRSGARHPRNSPAPVHSSTPVLQPASSNLYRALWLDRAEIPISKRISNTVSHELKRAP